MSEKHIFERSSGYSGTRCTGCGAWWYADAPSACKCDQPKPMSVEEARKEAWSWTIDFNDVSSMSDTRREDATKDFDNLIAAVERRERERVLAEFRMLAETFVNDLHSEVDAGHDLRRLIQSLETTNQKP